MNRTLFLALIGFTILSHAKMDPVTEDLSDELLLNRDIQKCYSSSPSGKKQSTETAIVNISLNEDGSPRDVAAIQNPEQTKDPVLKSCLENIILSLRFPAQVKMKKEIQVRLTFPVAK